jgi:hypothetical protein
VTTSQWFDDEVELMLLARVGPLVFDPVEQASRRLPMESTILLVTKRNADVGALIP